jgi:predicted RNA-binding Zn-ribbon protein involved in translation (DUF1610 family)
VKEALVEGRTDFLTEQLAYLQNVEKALADMGEKVSKLEAENESLRGAIDDLRNTVELAADAQSGDYWELKDKIEQIEDAGLKPSPDPKEATADSKVRLVECPFCGGTNTDVVGTLTGFTVMCHDCKANGPEVEVDDEMYALHGPGQYEAGAAFEWNYRTMTRGNATCPFCGSTGISVSRDVVCGEAGQRVVCDKCGAAGPFLSDGEAKKLEGSQELEAWRMWNGWGRR